MKNLKDSSYDIVRLIIYQIGISIFALVLYTSMGELAGSNDDLGVILKVIFSVFSTLFYWVLLYMAMWEMGAKDIIKIESGKLENVKGKGAVLSLFANIPNFVFAGIALVSTAVGGVSESESIVNACNTLYFLFNLLMRFISAMYIGVVSAVCSPLSSDVSLFYMAQSLLFILIPFFTVAVCQMAYSLGKKNFRLFSRVKK